MDPDAAVTKRHSTDVLADCNGWLWKPVPSLSAEAGSKREDAITTRW